MIDTRRQRHRLGQHLLVSHSVCEKMVDAADLLESDTVLEIGTGQGFLTQHIASRKVSEVKTFEIDKEMFFSAKNKLSSFSNVHLTLGDAFKLGNEELNFDVCISSLPYSRSLDFIRLLSLKAGSFRTAVVLIQSDFARKIRASANDTVYRAISVISQISFSIEDLGFVEKSSFSPPPRVNTVMVRLGPKPNTNQPFFSRKKISILSRLFSFRGRLLRSALKGILDSKEMESLFVDSGLLNKRIESISPNEYEGIVNWLDEWTGRNQTS